MYTFYKLVKFNSKNWQKRESLLCFSVADSMVVYVIIGVVGFAAGAGGILWAVCMFIRR